MAEIICTLVKNLSPNRSGALMMSMGVNILAMMLNWLAVELLKDRNTLIKYLKN